MLRANIYHAETQSPDRNRLVYSDCLLYFVEKLKSLLKVSGSYRKNWIQSYIYKKKEKERKNEISLI